jgi:hypothetical protein
LSWIIDPENPTVPLVFPVIMQLPHSEKVRIAAQDIQPPL